MSIVVRLSNALQIFLAVARTSRHTLHLRQSNYNDVIGVTSNELGQIVDKFFDFTLPSHPPRSIWLRERESVYWNYRK